MQSASTAYSLAELAEKAGVSTRTVRYYLQHGLLPSPQGGGPGSYYDDGHLTRLRLIKRLQDTHLPLAVIRKQIKQLSDEEVHVILNKEPDKVPDTAVEYIRSILDEREKPQGYAKSGALNYHFAMPQTSAMLPSDQVRSWTSHEPTRNHWERIGLSPDIEFHVRRPLTYQQNKAVNRILEAAREILQEEAP